MLSTVGSPALAAPVSSDEAAAERWRQWRLRGDTASIAEAKKARIAFTMLFAALGVWFVLQLL